MVDAAVRVPVDPATVPGAEAAAPGGAKAAPVAGDAPDRTPQQPAPALPSRLRAGCARSLHAAWGLAVDQWFIIGLGVAIGLAAAVPSLGKTGVRPPATRTHGLRCASLPASTPSSSSPVLTKPPHGKGLACDVRVRSTHGRAGAAIAPHAGACVSSAAAAAAAHAAAAAGQQLQAAGSRRSTASRSRPPSSYSCCPA